MSNLNTEAYLRAKGIIQDTEVNRDRPCRECGYNLRGLQYGGRCPECGTVIERTKPVHDHLMDAPRSYLRGLCFGTGFVAAGFWGPIAAVILSALTGSAVMASLGRLVLLGGAALFIIGGWIVTRPKPHEQTMSRPWHHPAYLTRATILITPTLHLLALLTPGGATVPFLGLFIVASTFTQFALLAWIFSDLALWARDDSVGNAFNALVVLFGLIGATELALRLFGLSIAEFMCIGVLIIIGCFVWFFITALRLFGTVNQALKDKARHDAAIFRDPARKLH